MKRKEFLKDITIIVIDGVNELSGLMFLRRLRHRLVWGIWCKHHYWTSWERVGDYRFMQQCEGCMIRRMK